MSVATSLARWSVFEKLNSAKQIIQQEADALARLAKNIPIEFEQAIDLICDCRGSVIVTGIGKAGWIGQKISATLASTGTRSHFLHPSEALHGDLGRVGDQDVVMVLSNSGETAEILQLLPAFKKASVPIIAVVSNERSTLARDASVTLAYGSTSEACALGLAPSTSTTIMLALGDSIALVASGMKGFQPIDFAKFHPGGSLGKKLSTVDDIMRPIDQCRVANDHETIREIYVRLSGPQRRSGAILLTAKIDQKLSGIFTDSDLAKLLERGLDQQLDQPVHQVMTANPKTVQSGTQTFLAVENLACHNISELPVVDGRGRPMGIVDITDVVGILPRS